MDVEALHPLLLIACAWPALGLAAAIAARLRARRRLGEALHVEPIASRGRALLLVLLLLAGAGLFAFAPASLWAPGSTLLALALANAWVAPSLSTRVLGEAGVQSGWCALRLERLEEWRLTGEHLRYRLGEEWLAVACPLTLQARVRAGLERAAPGRESRFRS